ncbi:hypothetical protein [Kamptonema formosum]|nr:hypothetical protein [Oscillatoria sp. PCC 10802]
MERFWLLGNLTEQGLSLSYFPPSPVALAFLVAEVKSEGEI